MMNDDYCDKCYSKGFQNAIRNIKLPKAYLLQHPEIIEAKMYQSLIKNNSDGEY